jgi:nucleolar complex protein 2
LSEAEEEEESCEEIELSGESGSEGEGENGEGEEHLVFEDEGKKLREDATEAEEGLSLKDHKKSLQKVLESDPDFFSFLRENDAELLNFDPEDSDDEDEDEDEDEDQGLHRPNQDLEVGTIESRAGK